MKIRLLLDENMSPQISSAVWRYEPAIDILRVGAEGAPLLGTLDPDILLFCEAERRVLVTDNRKSMPRHLADHFAAGHHHWGVFEVRHLTTIGQLARELHMFWVASEAEEWIDRTEHIPY